MARDAQLLADLGAALEDAVLVDVGIDERARRGVLRLHADADEGQGAWIQLMLVSLRRIQATLRGPSGVGPARQMTLEELMKALREFLPQEIYGQPFFDDADDLEMHSPATIANLDWRAAATPDGRHTLNVSLETDLDALDVRIWFDEVQILGSRAQERDIARFVAAAGERMRAMRGTGPVPERQTIDVTWETPEGSWLSAGDSFHSRDA